jgi:hypothetical protein
VYGDDSFFDGGAGYANYPTGGELLLERGRAYHDLLAPFVGREAQLIDVGTALASPFRKLARVVPDSWNVPYSADDIFYCLYRRT